MQRAYWLTCCWPGLSQLWIKGQWSGLLSALLFAGLLNMAVLSQLIWPELLPTGVAWSLWPLVGGYWLYGLVQSYRQLPTMRIHPVSERAQARADNEEQPAEANIFAAAQREYMKQNWYEAEMLLLQLLNDCETDIEARLMLAALYRHTGRLDEAEQQLQQVSRSDRADEWSYENEQQREQIKHDRLQDQSDDDSATLKEEIRPAA
jgi:hypothetical protein